jgi:UPF0755 protein
VTFYDDGPSGPRRPPRPGRGRGRRVSGATGALDPSLVDDDIFVDDGEGAHAGAADATGHADDGAYADVPGHDGHEGHEGHEGHYDEYDDDHGHDDYDHEDYVALRHERFPRWVAVLAIFVVLLVSVIGGGAWWYHRQVDPPGAAGAVITVQVPTGSSSSRIGELMQAKGVIRNSTLFNFYASRKSAGPWLAGDYRLQKNSSYDEAIAALAKGPGKVVEEQTTKVTIPEGFTLAKILARIQEKIPRLTVADLQAALDSGKVPSKLKPAGATSYEGLLFPATYEVGNDTTAVQLLTQMAGTMDDRVGALGVTQAQAAIKAAYGVDVTPYDLIKIASMIQYEAAGEADAAKIGTVTYNRLSKGIALGYDSTSIYEAMLANKDITKIDYKVATPYNTRIARGLPPTPIDSPGTYALEGAFKPASGPWLYFVLTDSKEVTFTVTYGDFQKAKALCKQRKLGCG